MFVKKYDFIVVGAGPSGSSLSYQLATSEAQPSVLLVEAGGSNDNPEDRVGAERHTFWATTGLHLDYGYKTAPQTMLNGREIAYHRGKGMGGSTATNLGLWDYGSKPEYNEWARLVDGTWNWENVCARMKKIERCHNFTPAEFEKYVSLEADHGIDGPVDVSYPAIWDPYLPMIMDAIESHGFPLNPDVNSDQCIGFGVPPSTIHEGQRVTASSAYLSRKPNNLDILSSSQVSRILFEDTKATGIELSDGKKHYSSKEIIICSGSIDTPKLLLLSGVGPAEHLSKHNISPVVDIPSIGSNLKDHPMIRLAAEVQDGVISLDTIVSTHGAKDQWLKDKTGPFSSDIGSTGHGYFKLDVTSYPEIELLDEATQKHLSDPQTPTFELVTRITPKPSKDGFIWTAAVVMMNSQSKGSVSLRSGNSNDPPVIDLNFLSAPYDVRATIEAVKETLQFLQNSSIIPIKGLAAGPHGLGDSDILEYIKANLGHLWHAAGTVRMGKVGDADACVTPDFKVVGLDGLRVADLSVLPVMPSNHTQSTAYLIGEVAAEKLIAEYQLG